MTANQIAYQNLKEQQRANLVKEQETARSNLAKEQETYRSNVAKETESHRTNVANEKIKGTGVMVDALKTADQLNPWSLNKQKSDVQTALKFLV